MHKSNNNNLFYTIVAIIIVAASFFYSWKYLLPNYVSNQTQIASLDQEIRASKTKLESLKNAQVTLASLGDTVNKMLVAVPGDTDTPDLITEIEATAAKYSTVIPSIQISDNGTGSAASSTTASASTGGNSTNQVGVSFAVTGSFENMNGFMSALENDVRFMNIQSVTLSTGGSGSGQMSMLIQLTAYKRVNTSLSSTTSGANN